MDANMDNTGAMLSYQPQPSMNVGFQASAPSNGQGPLLSHQQADMRNSAGANNVIEEEDYQQSSHAQFARLAGSNVATVENITIRTQQPF